jgi:hypothetical protein
MKKAIQSRTIWINTLTLGVGVIGYFLGQDLIADNASVVAFLIAVQGALNVAVRFVTNQAIK